METYTLCRCACGCVAIYTDEREKCLWCETPLLEPLKEMPLPKVFWEGE